MTCVVQEAVLTRMASMHYGGMELPWEKLEKLIIKGFKIGEFIANIKNRTLTGLERGESRRSPNPDRQSLKEPR